MSKEQELVNNLCLILVGLSIALSSMVLQNGVQSSEQETQHGLAIATIMMSVFVLCAGLYMMMK